MHISEICKFNMFCCCVAEVGKVSWYLAGLSTSDFL